MSRLTTLISIIALTTLLLIGLFGYCLWPRPPDLSHLANIGEKYDVEILRDTWGVPHIYGKTDADAAFGLAYAHAEDDFVTIQETLLTARGELATVFGSSAATGDYLVNQLRVWDVVEAGYDTDLSPETKAIVEAYADGVNLYAALHTDQVLSPDLFPVTGKDVVAYSVLQLPLFYGLDAVLTELITNPQTADISARNTGFNNFDTRFGSQTFSIAPERTVDGSTFLAVNAHQPWDGATAWYEAHVHSEEGWNMTGGTLPTTPAITLGHNPYLGWSFAVNYPDLVDVYLLEINPDNENQYLFDGQWLDIEHEEVFIKVKLLGCIKLTTSWNVYWSIYGPVIRTEQAAYAIRYAGFGRVDVYEQLYRMNKATSFAEWQSAVREGPIPNLNLGYADNEGNIYYLYNAKMPIRADGYDWSGFLPGNTSDTLWTEYLPFEELPQVLNPPSGFVQNANSSPFQTTLGPGNPNPADYSPTMGIETFMTNRALRALELIGGDESITFDEFYDIKYDWTYTEASDVARIQEMLGSWTPPPDDDLQKALKMILDWDLKMDPDSPAPTLMSMTIYFLLETNEHMNPSRLVGSDITYEQLIPAFMRAVTYLKETHGRIDIPWGEMNRLIRGDQDLALAGGADVLHAIYGVLQDDGRFKGFQGDSFILLVRWNPAGEVESYSIHQYGSATSVENSPHFDDQAPWFANRQLKPVWFDEDDIRANLERAYRPGDE